MTALATIAAKTAAAILGLLKFWDGACKKMNQNTPKPDLVGLYIFSVACFIFSDLQCFTGPRVQLHHSFIVWKCVSWIACGLEAWKKCHHGYGCGPCGVNVGRFLAGVLGKVGMNLQIPLKEKGWFVGVVISSFPADQQVSLWLVFTCCQADSRPYRRTTRERSTRSKILFVAMPMAALHRELMKVHFMIDPTRSPLLAWPHRQGKHDTVAAGSTDAEEAARPGASR